MPNEISLRDYFAAQALSALLIAASNPASNTSEVTGEGGDMTNNWIADARGFGWGASADVINSTTDKPYSYAQLIAEEAYELSHAMLAESAKWKEMEATSTPVLP